MSAFQRRRMLGSRETATLCLMNSAWPSQNMNTAPPPLLDFTPLAIDPGFGVPLPPCRLLGHSDCSGPFGAPSAGSMAVSQTASERLSAMQIMSPGDFTWDSLGSMFHAAVPPPRSPPSPW